MPDSWQAFAPVATILAGGLLLLLGRRLFWLFVGVIGFVVAFRVGGAYLGGGSGALVAALVVGALGAVAAVLIQKLALTLAGFAAGALGLVWLAEQLEWPIGLLTIAGAVLAGFASAWLLRALFELGLVALSSLAGAALVVEGLGPQWLRGPLLVALAVLGVLFQLARGRQAAAEG